jgi:hypothetical protein
MHAFVDRLGLRSSTILLQLIKRIELECGEGVQTKPLSILYQIMWASSLL